MKILAFSAYPPMPGGGAKATFEIFKRMSSHNPTYVVTYQKNVVDLDNVHVYHFCLSMKTSFFKGALFILMSSIVGVFLGFVKKVDVIYSKNLVSVGISGYMVSKVLRKPYVIHTSGPDIQNPALHADSHSIFGRYYSRIVRLFTKIELKHAHQIVANCREDANKIHLFGFKDKTQVIYNGIDHERFQPNSNIRERMRRELRIRQDDFVICYCGSTLGIKNLGVLLQIAAKFNHFKFLFIGPVEQDLEKFGRISSNCICTGQVKNTENYYQTSDVYMSPTLGEGLSNALLEAMACGLAVISYPAGDAPLIISERENGFLVDSVETASKRIRELHDDLELRTRLGINSRKTIVNNFNWDKTAKELNNLLFSTIGEP